MHTKRALIVEDEMDDQKRIQGLLDSRGIEYDTVDSALAAQWKLKQRRYYFVILDLDLGTGSDEGKFLLDTMLRENLNRPTIIVSHAGLLPETVALKGIYQFVKESIDKKNLHTLLSVFDRAINEVPNNGKPLDNIEVGIKRALWSDLLPLLVAFAVISAIIVTISRWVSPLLLGIVLVAALLVFLSVGLFLWRRHDELSEGSFVRLIDSVIQAIPLLRRMRSEARNDDKPRST